jgi:hypothetical protein
MEPFSTTRPSTTKNAPKKDKVAVLWQCPSCGGWNVSEHAVASIKRTWRQGSGRYRTQATCQHDGTTPGLPKCPGNPRKGHRMPLNTSRGGRPSVNIVRRHGGHVEAAVKADKKKQVERLRSVAEAANMGLALGESSTLGERKRAWQQCGGQGDQPWSRWERITTEADEE